MAHPLLFRLLAMIQESDSMDVKEKKKAVETLETLVKKFPNHARARDAATLIADLKK